MAESNMLKEWWVKALLGEELSAHPVFDRHVHVEVDGDAVTLTGEVGTADEREEIEAEARSIGLVHSVVNRLRVAGGQEPQRLQTIIAIFSSERAGQLAQQAVSSWKLQDERSPDLLADEGAARACLEERARAAEVAMEDVQRYLDVVERGKVLLVDRVREEEAFRVISALQGTDAESVHTLPPEPDTLVRS